MTTNRNLTRMESDITVLARRIITKLSPNVIVDFGLGGTWCDSTGWGNN